MSEEEEIPELSPDLAAIVGQEALIEIGKMGLTIHRGVIRDGGTQFEAFQVTAAFFSGMFKGNQQEEKNPSET